MQETWQKNFRNKKHIATECCCFSLFRCRICNGHSYFDFKLILLLIWCEFINRILLSLDLSLQCSDSHTLFHSLWHSFITNIIICRSRGYDIVISIYWRSARTPIPQINDSRQHFIAISTNGRYRLNGHKNEMLECTNVKYQPYQSKAFRCDWMSSVSGFYTTHSHVLYIFSC